VCNFNFCSILHVQPSKYSYFTNNVNLLCFQKFSHLPPSSCCFMHWQV
jgi:hypothetical protein